ncbi:calcium-binding protein [Falsiroseomonas sp. HC035]|uniref:calcium-binding protein n=1 Tax=Falsiroseomonas sp. HC035 TaxID=3390999 RepID=UPI003D319897
MQIAIVTVLRGAQNGFITLEPIWLFTAGPEQTVSLDVADWGDGASEVFTPQVPSFAFTHSHVYAGAPGQPLALDSVARFNVTILDVPAISVQEVSLYLAPDAVAGVSLTMEPERRSLVVLGVGGSTVVGGAQEDTVYGSSGGDLLSGRAGNDLIDAAGGDNTLLGGAGNDTLAAGDGDDRLVGGFGDDILTGGGGNDTLTGGDGADVLYGVSGANALIGGAGNDQIIGGTGDDRIRGDAGADSIWGGAGDERIQGNDGDDLIYGEDGHDLLNGGSGADTLNGGYGDNTLLGGEGHDLLVGGWDNDLINGGAGNDYLIGGAGNDTLLGAAGADTFYGGTGADLHQTQADGAQDVFMFVDRADGGDVIRGFVSGEDVIRIFFGTAGPLVQGVAPVAGAESTLLFNTTNGALRFDMDGLGGDDPVLIATLRGVTALADGDVIFG